MPLPRPRNEAAADSVPPGTSGVPGPVPASLARFNAAPAAEAAALLLRCCGSRRWAARVAGCRPYPDVDALLAACDEASYDMAPEDLAEALAAESAQHPPAGGQGGGEGGRGSTARGRRGVVAAHTALHAAHAAYESRFGHAFLICLDGCQPGQWLDVTLAGVRARLGNDAEEERVVAADELRRTARGRLARLVVAAR